MRKILVSISGIVFMSVMSFRARAESIAIAGDSRSTLVAVCDQKPGGCHQECNDNGCSDVCISGVNLKLYKNKNSIYDVSISVLDAVTGATEFNEQSSGFTVSEVVVEKYLSEIDLSLDGMLSNPENKRLINRNVEQGLSLEVSQSPISMKGHYNAYVSCDYNKVSLENCYSSNQPVTMLGDTEYGYVQTGRFECQMIDKKELGIEY